MRPVQPPNPNTRTPKLKAPPGACDTHPHVYGPFDRYPLVAERNYDPDPRSTLDDYLKVHRTLGLERAVIVTGMLRKGSASRFLLSATAESGLK
jgi:predicted TIM-barrel fold metal-dependent hydrolase